MKLDALLQRKKISDDRSYWFIRTDSGSHFDTFIENKFIGIGWNEITKADIEKKTATEVKAKLANHNNYNLTKTSGKSKTTAIYTKLQRFNHLKKGDLVIIPAAASHKLAFGIVQDRAIYVESQKDKLENCSYRKRRKIKWLMVESMHNLDNIFYKIIQSRHAISDVKKYDQYIDNVTEVLYEKNDYVHFVLTVTKDKDVKLDALTNLMQSIGELADKIDKAFQLEDVAENLSVRLNVQSPGKIEIKRKVGSSIVLLAIILSSCTGANPQPTNNPKVDGFIKVNIDTLKKVDKSIKQLEIDEDKIKNL